MNKEELIAEWAENPTTIALFEEIDGRLKELAAMPTSGCLHYGEPIKTHEAIIGQDMKAFLYAQFMQALKGDWSFFTEEDDDSDAVEDEGYEQVGDNPGW